jgi:signal transduction histidine kinase
VKKHQLERAPLLLRWPRLVETVTASVAVVNAGFGMASYAAGGQVIGLVGVALNLASIALVSRWPWIGVALACAGPLAGALLGVDPLVLGSMSVFTALAAALRGLSALPVGVLVGLANYWAVTIHGSLALLDPLAALSFVTALAFAAAGASLRANRRYWEEVKRSADEALATREAEAERRVAEERLRIAHDLHDTLGHEVALVSMSVGAAEVHLDVDPDAARADLAQARLRIQRVLGETGRVLSVLRNPADNAPTASFSRIPRLVEEFRAAGMDIRAVIADEPERLDPEAGVAVYRIVQEALVNARKHGAGTVRLEVGMDRQEIRIEVANQRAERPQRSQLAGGYGLVGMRERAASAGGRIELEAGDAVFTLRASLPIAGKDV